MKRTSQFFFVLSALCLSSSLLGGTFNTWQDIVMEKPYGPWTLLFNQETMFNNRGKHLFLEFNDIGYWYTGITKWFAVGAFYRYVMYEPALGKMWLGVHAPHLDARIRAKRDNFLFQLRTRFQYLSGKAYKEEWLMRNEFLVSFNSRIVEVFGGVEPFYNITTKKLPENYLFAGIGKQVGDHFNGKIYYRNQQFPHRTAGRVNHYLCFLITLLF